MTQATTSLTRAGYQPEQSFVVLHKSETSATVPQDSRNVFIGCGIEQDRDKFTLIVAGIV